MGMDGKKDEKRSFAVDLFARTKSLPREKFLAFLGLYTSVVFFGLVCSFT
jgi:F0F1-type ATP synthase membrane subunit c/vacuolar-type H+-ATPase subunit K